MTADEGQREREVNLITSLFSCAKMLQIISI